MRIVVDTNILVSGMFWAGPPRKLILAWLAGRFTPVVSPEIVEEYRATTKRLSEKREVDVSRLLERLLMQADFVLASELPMSVCTDPNDDKFISAAISGRARLIVTGDKALLKVKQFRKVRVLSAKAFARMVG